MRVTQILRLRGALLRASAAHQPRALSAMTTASSFMQTRAALLLRSGNASMIPTAREFRRQLVTVSFVKLDAASAESAASAATSSTATAVDATASADAAEAANATQSAPIEDVDNVKIDLSTIGAETTRVLTIANVLNTREQQVANGPSTSFEEWESIPGSQSVHDAIELMVKRNMRSLIVTEESSGIVGIITERDVLRKTSPRTILTTETLVRDIMSSHIMCVPPSTTVIDALATMSKENIRHLAVINGELGSTVKIGSVPEEAMRCVLSIKDIVKAYAEFEAEKKRILLEQLEQQQQAQVDTEPAASADATATPTAPSDGTPSAEPAPATPATPLITAATLLKKKHKKIKLILNTREEDNISVADAVEAMARQNFGAVLIVDKDQRVLGIFTERDYLAKVVYYKEDPATIRMVDVSTRNVACLQIEDTLEKCWSQAAIQDFRHFPVVGVMRKGREKELAGILSIKDIVREISKEHHTTPGFRLIDFFKSKMEPKPQEAPPAPVTSPAPATAAPAESASTPEVAASSTPTPEATASKQEKEASTTSAESKSSKQ